MQLGVRCEKFMFICPLIMSATQIPSFNFSTAKAFIKCLWLCIYIINYLMNYLWGNFSSRLSLFPSIIMIFFHVVAIILHEFKIFYSVIRFVTIDMMNTLVSCELATKRLFHNIPMLKDSFAINVDSDVPIFSKARLPLFEIWPIWRNIVITMSKFSRPVHLANSTLCLFEDIHTAFYSAFLSFYHSNTPLNNFHHYNVMGKDCQP